MTRIMPCLLLTVLLGGLALGAVAQGPKDGGGGKKAGVGKAGEPAKDKAKDKDGDTAKPTVPKLPPGTIVISPDDLKALPLWPRMIWIEWDKYQAMQKELAALKQPPKVEKASSCEMTGRFEADYVVLRAEFAFATQEAGTTVFLGLNGGQLTEKGDLDGTVPLLDYRAEEGFTVRVEKPAAQHRLVLNLRVPVVSSRASGGTALERSFDLGLPGTAITTLGLELAAAVKEVRWNGTPEKPRAPGKWLLAFGLQKKLSLSWREAVTQGGAGPHLTAEGKIKVSLRDTHAELSAELLLEDPRGQTKECELALPAQADVKLEAPPGRYELLPPNGKNPNHVLRFLEPSAEPWKVAVFARVPHPAPGGRLAVGPFYVQGAEHQRGIITVLSPETPHKQRLIYHPFGDVFQRDPPKGPEVEAVFQYWGMPNPAKAKGPAGRVPLELEIRAERGALEAVVNATLKLRSSADEFAIGLNARVQIKAPYGAGDFVELQLPGLPPPGPVAWATPLEFQVSEEGIGKLEMSPPDSLRRCRVTLPRSLGKSFTLTIGGKYAVADKSTRVKVGLPRLLGVTEHGSKVLVQSDESQELLIGDRGSEEPVPDKHRYQLDELPAAVELVWRPFRPGFPVEALIDIIVHERTAEVRQQLSFGQAPSPGTGRTGEVQLEIPAGIKGLTLIRDDQRMAVPTENGHAWVTPDGKQQKAIVLEYDIALTLPADDDAEQARLLEIASVWPLLATRRGAKVRVWCDGGTRVAMTGRDGAAWQDRGVEPVAGHSALPALVLRGDGPVLPLTLRLDAAASNGVAALLCDRALIQGSVGEDDALACRARYVVTSIGRDAVEVEFPVRVVDCQLKVLLGGLAVPWEGVVGEEKVARIHLKRAGGTQPVVLDIQYKLAAATQEGRLIGLTTIYPPVFRDPVEVTRVRWQLSLPYVAVSVPLSPAARPDYRWTMLHGWLPYPEPSVSSGDLENWLYGKTVVGEPLPVSVAFARSSAEPQRVLHQPRMQWVLCCSVPLVVLALGLYFFRLSRLGLALVLGLLGLGGVALAVTCPALLPALYYGSQPALFVIVLMLVVLWLLQERYRRQLVFIPGFARLKAGSSLIPAPATGKRRDASTIDAPVPAGVVAQGTTTSKK
jgi:hypothetical protein